MTQPDARRGSLIPIASAVMALLAVVFAGWWMLGPSRDVTGKGTRFEVSQSGRRFRPDSLRMEQRDTLRIVNDDGDLTHHAYIASDRFRFDSGDQPPGKDVIIKFPVSGTFDVLCGIHPKMRLTVNVD